MALQLDQNYKGVTANYWRINILNYDDIQDQAVVHLWLYKDKASSDESLSNGLVREVHTIKGIKNIMLPEDVSPFPNPRDLLKYMLYVKLKESNIDPVTGNELNKFASATDV